MWDHLIIDVFNALYLWKLSSLILNSQCKKGAKEVNNKRVPHLSLTVASFLLVFYSRYVAV